MIAPCSQAVFRSLEVLSNLQYLGKIKGKKEVYHIPAATPPICQNVITAKYGKIFS